MAKKTVQDAIDKEKETKKSPFGKDWNPDEWERVSSQILRFAEPGDWFMGTYESNEPFEGEFDVPCKCHKMIDFETGNRISCVLGSMADTFLEEANIKKGDKVYLRFNGTKETRKGNKVNDYDIRIQRS